MKVFELMQELSRVPAGTEIDVFVAGFSSIKLESDMLWHLWDDDDGEERPLIIYVHGDNAFCEPRSSEHCVWIHKAESDDAGEYLVPVSELTLADLGDIISVVSNDDGSVLTITRQL